MSPVYQYRCERDHSHEQRLPMTADAGPKPCPECGKPAQRVILAPMLRADGAYSFRHDT